MTKANCVTLSGSEGSLPIGTEMLRPYGTQHDSQALPSRVTSHHQDLDRSIEDLTIQ